MGGGWGGGGGVGGRRAPATPAPGQKTAICLKVGAMDNLVPGAVVGTLCNAGGLRGEDIGRIDILPQVCFVEVPASEVPRLCENLAHAMLGVAASLAKQGQYDQQGNCYQQGHRYPLFPLMPLAVVSHSQRLEV